MTEGRELILGRERELSRVDAFVQGGLLHGEALVMLGEPGVGKSTLLHYAVDQAAAAGALVVVGGGAEAETDVGFAALDLLLHPLRAHIAALSARHRDALGVCIGLVDGPPPQRSTVTAATIELMSRLADRGPVLIAVDDAHHVDRPSADVLSAVAHHLAGQPICLLLVMSQGAHSYVDHGTLAHIWVGPLGRTDAEALLAQRAPDLPQMVKDWVLAQASGSPLAILELPLDVPPTGRTDLVPAMSSRLIGMYSPRIRQLPQSARHFLLLAALDHTGDLTVIVGALGDSGSEAEARVCARQGLVVIGPVAGSLRFTHPLIRSTVVALATWLERREAHQSLGMADTTPPQQRAQHLAAAAFGPDESVATVLEESAEVLLGRADAAGAVATLLRAAELSEEPKQRARRLAWAAYVGADFIGDLDRISPLLSQARREAPHTEQSLETAIAGAYLLLNGDGDVENCHRLLVGALQAAEGTSVSDAARTEAVFTLLWICFFAGRTELWDPFWDELARLGTRAPQPLRLCAATFAAPLRTGAAAREELRSAIATLEMEPDAAQVALIARAAFYMDELAGCRTALWKVVAGNEVAAATSAMSAWILLGFEAFLDGQWDESVACCERGLLLTETRGYQLLSWPARYGVALVAAARGEEDRVAALTDQMLQWAQPRGVRSVLAYAHHAMAVDSLGRRDFENAYRHASEVSLPGVIDPGLAHALWLMLDLVDSAVHSGRVVEAVAHVQAMHAARVDQLSTRYALILAGCDALAAGPERAGEAFERALRSPEADRWPFELARVELGYGEHLRRIRLHIQAREHLLSALEGFTLLRAEPWVARARSELRASSSPRRVDGLPNSLTDRELEVAKLAATGLTNAQIGVRLGASPRTVAAHLVRALAKLQITARGALRDALTSKDSTDN